MVMHINTGYLKPYLVREPDGGEHVDCVVMKKKDGYRQHYEPYMPYYRGVWFDTACVRPAATKFVCEKSLIKGPGVSLFLENNFNFF